MRCRSWGRSLLLPLRAPTVYSGRASPVRLSLSWPDIPPNDGFRVARAIGASGSFAQVATVATDVRRTGIALWERRKPPVSASRQVTLPVLLLTAARPCCTVAAETCMLTVTPAGNRSEAFVGFGRAEGRPRAADWTGTGTLRQSNFPSSSLDKESQK